MLRSGHDDGAAWLCGQVFSWPRSNHCRPRSNDAYVPILNSYSASESGSRLYIFDPPTNTLAFVGSCERCGSECDLNPSAGLLTKVSCRPLGLSTSAGNLLRRKNSAWPA